MGSVGHGATEDKGDAPLLQLQLRNIENVCHMGRDLDKGSCALAQHIRPLAQNMGSLILCEEGRRAMVGVRSHGRKGGELELRENRLCVVDGALGMVLAERVEGVFYLDIGNALVYEAAIVYFVINGEIIIFIGHSGKD